MNLEAQLQQGERELARIWKAMAFRGVLAIAFALVILIWPDIGRSALVALFGALALVSGVASIVAALKVPLERSQRAWLAFDGAVGVVIGIVVFVWPDLSALGLLYAIAAWAIATGILDLALALVVPFSGGRSLLLVLSGLLSVAFGVIMFWKPGDGAVALLALVAAFAFMAGVMQIAFALELRRIAEEVGERLRPHVPAKPVTHG